MLALMDPSAKVRAAAAKAAVDSNMNAAADCIAAAMELEDDKNTRTEFVRALAALGGESAIHKLETMLTDRSASVRVEAAAALHVLGEGQWRNLVKGEGDDIRRIGELADEDALRLLNSALDSDDTLLRAKAARAASNMGNHAKALLEKAAADSEWKVRLAAVRAAAKTDREKFKPIIVAMVSDPHRSVRTAAVEVFSSDAIPEKKPKTRKERIRREARTKERTETSARAGLFEKLQSDSPSKRAHAISMLERQADEKVREAFVEMIGTENDPRVLSRLIQAVSSLKEKDAAHLIEKHLRHEYRDVRLTAVHSLAMLSGEDAMDSLLEALDDSEGDVRRASEAALKRMGAFRYLAQMLEEGDEQHAVDATRYMATLTDNRSAQYLRDALVDERPKVRKAAAEALKKLGEEEWAQNIKGDEDDLTRLSQMKSGSATELLTTLLEHPDEKRRISALRALGNGSDRRAVGSIVPLLDDDSDQVVMAAAATLGKMRSKNSAPSLVRLLEKENWLKRAAAAMALGEIGDSSAARELQSKLNDPHFAVRREAVNALGKLCVPRTALAMLDLLGDENDEVRSAAKRALAKMANALGAQHKREKDLILRALGGGSHYSSPTGRNPSRSSGSSSSSSRGSGDADFVFGKSNRKRKNKRGF
ncbi:MAG: HEAT repeat domain-containing protein [Planctomycetota bacterium]|nr:HEAT repeat domain-containing protein [Planctomycetota bacterium]